MQSKLSREFQASLGEFQNVQRSALEKQRASASAARAAVEESLSPSSPTGQQQLGGLQSQEQQRLVSQDEVDFQESLIVEREAEIRNIEQGVSELNELFRDVAHIVREQGDQINTIEMNVDN